MKSCRIYYRLSSMVPVTENTYTISQQSEQRGNIKKLLSKGEVRINQSNVMQRDAN